MRSRRARPTNTDIRRLIEDRTRGSLEIFEEAMSLLDRSMDPCKDARVLREAHPEMTALEYLEMAACSGSMHKLREFYGRSKEKLAFTCSKLLSELGIEVIATLSRSSAVINCLKRSPVSEVIVGESRPGREGLKTAEILRDAGFKVTLVVDALLPWYSKRREAVGLVGADRVTPSCLINKAGTLPLATLIRTIAVPGLLKLHKDEYIIERRDPREVAVLEGVEVVNIYFDETPLNSLHRLVFEGLVLEPQEIGKAYEKLEMVLGIRSDGGSSGRGLSQRR